MSKDGFFTYNQSLIDEAIYETKKIKDLINLDKYKNLDIFDLNKYQDLIKKIPNSYKINEIMDVINKLSSINTYLDNTDKFLNTVKNELNQYVDNDTNINVVPTKTGYHKTTINGVDGYLYIPEGCTSTDGLPLITFLSGIGTMHDIDKVKSNHGLAKLLSEGYKVNAVVWIPTGTEKGMWFNSPDKENTINSINQLINDYNLDASKNVLMGYSLGAFGGYKMVADNPNLFSTFVSFGGFAANYNDYNTLSNSCTSIIMYTGTNDDIYGYNIHNLTEDSFNRLNSLGADIMMYEISGGTHGDEEYIFTDKLMSDVLNINKENTYVEKNKGQKITISRDQFVNSSILGGNKNSSNYYKTLANVSLKENVSNTGIKNDISNKNNELHKEIISQNQYNGNENNIIQENSLKNILPENSFSKAIPILEQGTLGTMEISKKSVSYDIYNIDNNVYQNYIKRLEQYGYKLKENGIYSNDKYDVMIMINNNNDMSISVKTL